MSPNPDVHEEELEKIEARKAKERRGCLPCGCGLVVLLLVFLGVGVWLFQDRLAGLLPPEKREALGSRFTALRDNLKSSDDAQGALDKLRQEARALREELEVYSDPDRLRAYAESLREELGEKRQSLEAEIEENMDALRQKSQAFKEEIRKTKAKTDKLEEEARAIDALLGKARAATRALRSEDTPATVSIEVQEEEGNSL